MPKLIDAVPKYRCHKASRQAVVTIAGKDHYLGPWRTKGSRIEYDDWSASGLPTVERSINPSLRA